MPSIGSKDHHDARQRVASPHRLGAVRGPGASRPNGLKSARPRAGSLARRPHLMSYDGGVSWHGRSARPRVACGRTFAGPWCVIGSAATLGLATDRQPSPGILIPSEKRGGRPQSRATWHDEGSSRSALGPSRSATPIASLTRTVASGPLTRTAGIADDPSTAANMSQLRVNVRTPALPFS